MKTSTITDEIRKVLNLVEATSIDTHALNQSEDIFTQTPSWLEKSRIAINAACALLLPASVFGIVSSIVSVFLNGGAVITKTLAIIGGGLTGGLAVLVALALVGWIGAEIFVNHCINNKKEKLLAILLDKTSSLKELSEDIISSITGIKDADAFAISDADRLLSLEIKLARVFGVSTTHRGGGVFEIIELPLPDGLELTSGGLELREKIACDCLPALICLTNDKERMIVTDNINFASTYTVLNRLAHFNLSTETTLPIRNAKTKEERKAAYIKIRTSLLK